MVGGAAACGVTLGAVTGVVTRSLGMTVAGLWTARSRIFATSTNSFKTGATNESGFK